MESKGIAGSPAICSFWQIPGSESPGRADGGEQLDAYRQLYGESRKHCSGKYGGFVWDPKILSHLLCIYIPHVFLVSFRYFALGGMPAACAASFKPSASV